MSEPRLSDAALDRLLGMVPAPPAPRADVAERIATEATRPGRTRARPVARRDRRRPWRRSIVTGVIALNLLAASAIASVISGVPVHLALARLAALPVHLFNRPHQEGHAAAHIHASARAAEPARALARGAAAPVASPPAERPLELAASLPAAARAVSASPALPVARQANAAALAARTAAHTRSPLAHAHSTPRSALAHTHVVSARASPHDRAARPRLAGETRGRAARERQRAPGPLANGASRSGGPRTADARYAGRMLGGERIAPSLERVEVTRQPRAETARAMEPASPPPSGRPRAIDRSVPPAGTLPSTSSPQRSANTANGRSRWASEVVVNPKLDGSPSTPAPAIEAPRGMQQRVVDGREPGLAMGFRPGQGMGMRPGQRLGLRQPSRFPKMQRMPKRQGPLARIPRGGRRRR